MTRVRFMFYIGCCEELCLMQCIVVTHSSLAYFWAATNNDLDYHNVMNIVSIKELIKWPISFPTNGPEPKGSPFDLLLQKSKK